MQARGGKRPDFVAKWTHEYQEIDLLFDAKHHDIAEGGAFRLTDAEIEKYSVTEKWMAEYDKDADRVMVIFIVIPKRSDGRDIYIIGLDEVRYDGVPCIIAGKSGKQILLQGRLADW